LYELDIEIKLQKQLKKLEKSDKAMFDAFFRKVAEILENPNRYENLRAPLNNLKSVHIQKSFVLMFSVDEESKIVTLEQFVHHPDKHRWNRH
jgi:YafQ family addiction module toxin component